MLEKRRQNFARTKILPKENRYSKGRKRAEISYFPQLNKINLYEINFTIDSSIWKLKKNYALFDSEHWTKLLYQSIYSQRTFLFNLIAHCLISFQTLLIHCYQYRNFPVNIIVYTNVGFSVVFTVQTPCILNNLTFKRYWHSYKKRIKSRIVKPLANIRASSQ